MVSARLPDDAIRNLRLSIREAQKAGFRVELDSRKEKMNAKIREFTLQKVPYVLVMGDKEESSEAVSVRTRGKGDQGSMPLEEFVARAQERVGSRTSEL